MACELGLAGLRGWRPAGIARGVRLNPDDQGGLLPFDQPPWIALLSAPFAAIGNNLGARLWILVELVALAVGLAVLARGGQRRWPALAAFASVPAALMALNAQIDGLVVLGLGAAFVLWRSDRRFVAGCALGLCLAKPHLVVGLALVLLKRIAYPVERSIPRDEFIFAGGAFRHINEAL